ncbi:hypothetical protein ACSXBP_14050 [Clostridium perfringens]
MLFIIFSSTFLAIISPNYSKSILESSSLAMTTTEKSLESKNSD